MRQRTNQLAELTKVLESSGAKKRFTPACFGRGQTRSGGVAARKARFEVLDRLARLGAGLSPEQGNDWAWFKSAWDSKMSQEHKVDWGGIFAGWVQRIVDDVAEGADNAFSLFMRNETRRCLHDTPVFVLPPVVANAAGGEPIM